MGDVLSVTDHVNLPELIMVPNWDVVERDHRSKTLV